MNLKKKHLEISRWLSESSGAPLVILDECHMLRNPKCGAAGAIEAFFPCARKTECGVQQRDAMQSSAAFALSWSCRYLQFTGISVSFLLELSK